MTDQDFMEKAVALAREGVRRGDGGPFGAVVVRQGEIVGEGWNRVLATHDATAHAEVVAIRDASRRLATFDLTGCDIYASCEPCPMCLGAIYWSRLGRLFHACTREDAAAFGFRDRHIYAELSLPAGERTLPTARLEVDGALGPFEAWRSREHGDGY